MMLVVWPSTFFKSASALSCAFCTLVKSPELSSSRLRRLFASSLASASPACRGAGAWHPWPLRRLWQVSAFLQPSSANSSHIKPPLPACASTASFCRSGRFAVQYLIGRLDHACGRSCRRDHHQTDGGNTNHQHAGDKCRWCCSASSTA